MNKLEKYINYIVEDLVNNTEIDYLKRTFNFPFFPTSTNTTLEYVKDQYAPPGLLYNYLQLRYGSRKEEVKIVWNIFKERILSLIKK